MLPMDWFTAQSRYWQSSTPAEFALGYIYALTGNGHAVSSLRYLRPFLGNLAAGSTENGYFAPFDMTLRRFLVRGTPGSGDPTVSTTYALRVNGVVALTLPVVATDANPYVSEDNSSEVIVLAGDRLAFTAQHSGAIVGTPPGNTTFLAEIKP